MRRATLPTTTAALAALLAPGAAPAAPVPSLRAAGPAVVACRPDSAARIRRAFAGRRGRREALRALAACRHHSIRAAVEAAGGRARVLVAPGVYRERLLLTGPGLRIEGIGARARDVVVRGDRRGGDVVRAARADGLVLANLVVEQGAGDAVRVVGSDGVRVHRVVVRWARDDGLAVTGSDHALLDRVEAYANGGAGVRVGPGARGPCGGGHGIEVRDANAYGNVVGFAGSSGDAVWVHRSRLAANATGASVDPFAAGPATPRGCLRFDHDSIASNNAAGPFGGANLAFCRATPFARRAPGVVCPRLATPAGSGLVLRGVNGAEVRDNAIYGNRRSGIALRWSPAAARGQRDPTRQFDTSNGNRFVANRLGAHRDGTLAPNATDVVWDGEGAGNCWTASSGDVPGLPPCPRGSLFGMGDARLQLREVPCAAWDPVAEPDPPGCDWTELPG